MQSCVGRRNRESIVNGTFRSRALPRAERSGTLFSLEHFQPIRSRFEEHVQGGRHKLGAVFAPHFAATVDPDRSLPPNQHPDSRLACLTSSRFPVRWEAALSPPRTNHERDQPGHAAQPVSHALDSSQ
jgi:hypothetical protein